MNSFGAFQDNETVINLQRYKWLLHTTQLPKIPETIQTLDLSNCLGLEFIPDLSEYKSLAILNCINCHSLESIGKLPDSLQLLNCDNCGYLQSLPTLPAFLATFVCSTCPSLKIYPKLPSNLDIFVCLENIIPLPDKLPLTLNTLDCSTYVFNAYLKNLLIFNTEIPNCTETYENAIEQLKIPAVSKKLNAKKMAVKQRELEMDYKNCLSLHRSIIDPEMQKYLPSGKKGTGLDKLVHDFVGFKKNRSKKKSKTKSRKRVVKKSK